MSVLTLWTLRWHTVSVAAVVARQLIHILVIRQRHVAVDAMWHPAAFPAFYHWRETATILKQYDLLAILQRLPDSIEESGRK